MKKCSSMAFHPLHGAVQPERLAAFVHIHAWIASCPIAGLFCLFAVISVAYKAKPKTATRPAIRAPVPYSRARLMAADFAVADADAVEAAVLDADPDAAVVAAAAPPDVLLAAALELLDATDEELLAAAEAFLEPQVTDWQAV